MENIGIIGAGSWGTALARLLYDNGHKVTVWSILEDEVEMLRNKREHTDKLPGVKLPADMEFTTDLEAAATGRDMLVMVTPSVHVRATSRLLAGMVPDGQIIVDAAKGIEEDTLMTMTQIMEAEIPKVNAAVLSGPSHAEEVGRKLPTSVVVGARDKTTAGHIQDVFMNPVFRVYTSPDMLGIELGGAIKNVFALAAGIADGMGCGDNTKAALITRGIYEMTRLGVAAGGKKETFQGLSGVGDLIVTCSSMHSRNRRAGILIGQGMSMEDAMDQVKMVVEGVYSARAAKGLAERYGVQVPIIDEVCSVLFDHKSPKDALRDLMERERRDEERSNVWG